jgi:hypothetical protein
VHSSSPTSSLVTTAWLGLPACSELGISKLPVLRLNIISLRCTLLLLLLLLLLCAEEPPAKKTKSAKQAAGKQHKKKQHKSAADAGAEGGKEAAHKHKHTKHKQHSNAGADTEAKQKHKKKKSAAAAAKKDSRPHYGDMTGPSEEDVWQSDDSDNVVRQGFEV